MQFTTSKAALAWAALAYAAVALCAGANTVGAQDIVPLKRTSKTKQIELRIFERLVLTPRPRLPGAEQWQVRLIRANRATLATWGASHGKPVMPDTPADTCIVFAARVFTFSAPVDSTVLVSLVPDEDWFDWHGRRLEETTYFAVIEKRVDDERWDPGDFVPLRIKRSSINNYLSNGTEIVMRPEDDTQREVRLNLETAPIDRGGECRIALPAREAEAGELLAIACESLPRASLSRAQ